MKKFLLRVRTEKRTQSSKCVLCRIQSLCSMCAAIGKVEHRDAERPVNFFCEAAHLRAMALGTEVPAHGDCEYCAGGSQYARLQESARRITSGDIDVEGWTSSVLPVVNVHGEKLTAPGAQTSGPGFRESRCKRTNPNSRTKVVHESLKEPPALVAISLRPEEAVLGTCKNHSSGPGQASCSYMGVRTVARSHERGFRSPLSYDASMPTRDFADGSRQTYLSVSDYCFYRRNFNGH